jgi:hypothetical protein
MREGLRRTALGGASGLCAALLFTHDFYTVVLTSVVGVLILPVIAEPGLLRVRQRLQAARAPRPLSIVAAVLLAWALWIWISGGVSVELLGQRVSSRDWRRPASVGLAIAALLAYRDRAATIRGLFHRVPQWPLAFAGGAAIGMAAFLWIHAAAFREHPGFDHRQVFDQLVPFGTSPYLDLRPFLLAAALAGLTWIPWFRVDATTRRRATWLAIASAIVLMLPMRVADASLWTVLFHLPGVSAVRDPTRLVYFYQLALSLGIGVLLVRLAPNSWLRWATIALVAALVAGRARRGRPITSTRCTWRCARPSPLFSVTAHGRQRDGESAILPRPIIWTASIAGSPTTL